MAMENPAHPGQSIKENFLEPLGLSVTDAARVLGVARHTLSRVLNGHAAVSPEMAIRLEKAGWSNADFWLRRQTEYDLLEARRDEDRIEVERYGRQLAMLQRHGAVALPDIAILLGAGSSVAAGFPSTQDLTEMVVSGHGVTRHSDGCFYIGGGDEPRTTAVKLPNSMVGRLLDEAAPYLSKHADKTANYEDIYFLARQALDEELGETENPAIRRFVDSLRSDWPKLIQSALEGSEDVGRLPEPGVPDDLGAPLMETCNYIEDVVSQSLLIHRPAREGMGQLNNVEHVCRAFNVSSISTLCHDTHVETFLKGRDIALADGFSGREDDTSLWNGDLTSDVKIPYLKLHGCGYGFGDRGINSELVDWYYGRSGRRFVIIHPEPDSLVENARGAIRKHWGEWERNDSISIIEKRFEDIEIAEFEEAIYR